MTDDEIQEEATADAELIAESQLGEAARAFVESDIGRYILGCADQEKRDAQEALGIVEPTDAKKIASLQTAVWRAQSMNGWLVEIISKGDNALELWRQKNPK